VQFLLAHSVVRRLITVPTVLVLALLYLSLIPLLLVICLLIDLAYTKRMMACRVLLFAGLYLLSQLVGLTVALLINVLRGSDSSFLRANYWLQQHWAGALFKGASKIFNLKTDIEYPPEIESHIEGRPVILMVRHASTADSVFGSLFFGVPFKIDLRYVLKAELMLDPCLDVVGHRLPNAFIRRGGFAQQSVEQLVKLSRDVDSQQGVLIFPEGTRFTREKRESLLGKYRNDPQKLARVSQYSAVLPPRHTGVCAIGKQLPNAAWVTLGHAGVDQATSFSEFFKGALLDKTISVKLWVNDFDANAPLSEQIDDAWLELDRWVQQSTDDK